ncbi:hypothetical protein [Laspinema olomoucense]|uniref:AAA+ ATPase domain-containing protein n=1 Tax=Laspinema olomoucense D3b TaxID=2953688 RepID=A0ABT2NEG4_9CYAN|nr:hypothetical protein [Laspinema sp. D3b]MCT7981099.1 hypothetical protein [Laspinema sp. D3b]
MKQKTVELQTDLNSLAQKLLQLSEQLSEAVKKLQEPLIPPSFALAEQIARERQRFEELRSLVVQVAQSFGVSTPDVEEIISIKDIEVILSRINEAEQIVNIKNQEALNILDKFLQIRYSDNGDFTPLEQSLLQACELHSSILNWQENGLHPEAKILVSGEHPFVQLLTLISERESPDYQRLENLQKAVGQSLGTPVAIAALTGKLFFLSASTFGEEKADNVIPESGQIKPEVSDMPSFSDERERPEATESGTSKEAEVPNIPIPTPTHSQSDAFTKIPTDAQEIAVSLLNSKLEESQNELQYLIWQLIYEDKGSLAFNLARCLERKFPNIRFQLPYWVIRAVILGDHVRYEVGIGEIANILVEDFANFSESLFTGDGEWNQAISLLLAASALRPALLAPNTNASDILNHLRLGGGLSQLFEYCRAIANYGSQRYALNTTAIKTVRNQADWETDIVTLQQQVEEWFSHAPLADMIYGVAKAVWGEWLKPNNLIYSLLLPVRENNHNQVEIVRRYVDQLSSESQINAEVKRTQKEIGGLAGGNAITGTALNRIRLRVGEAVTFGRRWLQLQESRPERENDFSQQQAKQLKQELSNRHSAVLKELEDFAEGNLSGNLSGLIKAGISCCQRSVTNIQTLFASSVPLAIEESAPKYLLYADMLRIAELSLDGNWKPDNSENLIVKGILELLAQNNFDWSVSFYCQRENRNHEATEKIIEYLRAKSELSLNIEELSRMREEGLRECRDSLLRDLKETRNQIEQAVALGILKEADRFDYATKIVNIEKEVETTLRFDLKHENLRDIKAAIAQKKEVAIDQVRQRLNALFIGPEQPSYVRITELLERGNVLTANEYIDMVDRGDEIPKVVEAESNEFTDFFPIKVTDIDKFMEENNPPFYIQKVQRRESFCGINLKRPSGSATDRATEMLSAWFSAKRGGKSQQMSESDARTILVHLGFNPLRVTVERNGGRMWLQVTTEVIRNKELCPVAAYGSAAHGQYRILCVWDRPTVEDILNTVGETSHGSPAFVFFFGRLTEVRRRELARLCRERRRTFVLIDDILMLYLCGAEEPRLRTLFKCALPFTFLESYATTAGLVPPEIFYGRRQERDSIINSMGSCFIYGGRQLGKTALLRSVERDFHAPQERRIALFLDLKADGIGIHRPIEDIWSLLADEFKKFEVVPRNSPTNVGAETLLKHLQNWLEQDKSRRILLLLDESDKFLESDGQKEFNQTSRFKGLMDKTERRFKVVFAGLHNVQRTTRLENHPLAHYGEPVCIGPLLENGEWREARELIKRPLTSIGYELSDDLVTRILSQTNYYPSLIQLYCQELLRDVNKNHLKKYERSNTPPYEIGDKQVDEAYQSQNLRKAIRDRLLWTLQLDQRYEVIAYSIAYESLTSQTGMVDGFAVSWVQDTVLSWWSEGFQGKSTDEFRALLAEMVGLGVLRETDQGRFALRSPNVVLLLGTEAEIEEQLLRSREPSLGYDPEIFRSALRTDLSRRSPLTVQQESALRRRENSVSIIFGCPAAGLDELQEFLVSAVGQEFFSAIEDVSETSVFTNHLNNLDKREREIDGTTIIFVSSNCSWGQEWVRAALDKLHRLKSKKSFARVVFVANPQKLWELMNVNCLDSLVSQGVSLLSLKPWHDGALRQWLEDCDLALNKESREKITEITGNWSVLLQRLYQQAKSDRHWEPHLQKIGESLTHFDVLSELAILMGLDNPHSQQKQILRALATLEKASTEDLIEIVDGISNEIVCQTFRWAELLRLAYPIGNGNWSVDPLVGRILTSFGE